MGFDPAWLTARRRYDEGALDSVAVQAIRDWGAALPAEYTPRVVDLGSGTGAALRRGRSWLSGRPMSAYGVDCDARLLALATADDSAARPVGILGDLLEPLDGLGGPADGTVDLVLGHALADLLPLDRLAARVAALARPGGLIHLALAYDAETTFGPSLEHEAPDLAVIERSVLDRFHQHMDRPRTACPDYGGAHSGRRLAPALRAAGLEIVRDAPSVWQVAASDGPDGHLVLEWLLQFVAGAAREIGGLERGKVDTWEACRRAMLAAGTLTARVAHRDVLALRPPTSTGTPTPPR